MALAGSGSAWYRSNAAIPSSVGLHSADTMHCWVQSSTASSTADLQMIAGFVGGPSPAQHPQEQLTWNHLSGAYNKARVHRNSSSAYAPAQAAGTPATNTWEPWAGTFDGTNARIYRNGALDGTGSASSAGTANEVFVDVFGSASYAGSLTSGSQFVDGQIAEFAIWNVALSADEIASLAKGFRPPLIRPQSLVFYAPCVRALHDVRGGRTLVLQAGSDVASSHPRVYG